MSPFHLGPQGGHAGRDTAQSSARPGALAASRLRVATTLRCRQSRSWEGWVVHAMRHPGGLRRRCDAIMRRGLEEVRWNSAIGRYPTRRRQPARTDRSQQG